LVVRLLSGVGLEDLDGGLGLTMRRTIPFRLLSLPLEFGDVGAKFLALARGTDEAHWH
jgi:hypothetical protein